ncbi:dihydroxyacetone kinase phosphoryl donor subunit DhaM [Cryobacterium sp. PAMC25264]|uniref:dihydroxyacetone kinase phosphoryl donor subunit DhaM n=1 Tax=Cryobacterium sp. PAMC25264 TaxID=2861288 RepID=UPI001C627678|nr:dihydroxyacetone kinase phosphoryl donor subunit DhaM [Cryobacterium sp. PAMC25264]QYF74852.1 PTS-dependent dihydroxyacetone kinase phosphotransferase subunit DhaM [Cryobacterium sp. PAMC25264]
MSDSVAAGAAQPAPRVGLVFVSHSTEIASGLVTLARQMAPEATLVAAGGRDDDGIGTSFDKIAAGIARADDGGGVVVLCDLGSAILTAETAIEFLDDDVRSRVRIADAPLVEGGVAAAVAAQIGGDLDSVLRAAESAGGSSAVEPESSNDAERAGGAVVRTVTLRNRDGLHARPAADFVKLASTFDAPVSVNGKDAHSLLGIMSLGLTRGMSVEISGPDERSRAAVEALADLIETGFGEE